MESFCSATSFGLLLLPSRFFRTEGRTALSQQDLCLGWMAAMLMLAGRTRARPSTLESSPAPPGSKPMKRPRYPFWRSSSSCRAVDRRLFRVWATCLKRIAGPSAGYRACQRGAHLDLLACAKRRHRRPPELMAESMQGDTMVYRMPAAAKLPLRHRQSRRLVRRVSCSVRGESVEGVSGHVLPSRHPRFQLADFADTSAVPSRALKEPSVMSRISGVIERDPSVGVI